MKQTIQMYLVKANRVFGNTLGFLRSEVRAVEKLLRNKQVYKDKYIDYEEL